MLAEMKRTMAAKIRLVGSKISGMSIEIAFIERRCQVIRVVLRVGEITMKRENKEREKIHKSWLLR